MEPQFAQKFASGSLLYWHDAQSMQADLSSKITALAPMVSERCEARKQKFIRRPRQIEGQIIAHECGSQNASSSKTIGRSVWQNYPDYDIVRLSKRKPISGRKVMGALVHDPNVPQAQVVLNSRFAPGDPLKEMIAIQKEFDVFSLSHSLASASSLLNIAPPQARDRRGWLKFCNHLKDVPSDRKGMSAHDRIITAVRDDLASANPLPIFFTWHPGVKLEVSKGFPLSFSKTRYLIISAPVR